MILKCGNKKIILGHKTYVMGILNITPDSFSDGGKFNTVDKAISCAEQMLEDEVDIIDIGAESTRPFSSKVSLDEELNRILKIVTSLVARGITNISIDTCKSEVARQCLSEGASWINDVSAFSDVRMIKVASKADALILMHSRKFPNTIEKDKIDDNNIVEEVKNFLYKKVELAEKYNISKNKILIDQGIGFNKTFNNNLELIQQIKEFKNIGAGIVCGPSRKRFLGRITGIEKPIERDIATLGVVAFASMNDADIVRVHNVKGTVELLKVLQKLQRKI